MDLFSINMSANNGDVERRYADLTEYSMNKRTDLTLIQNVSSDVGHIALRKLTAQLGPDYSMHYEQVYPGQEDDQGIAVISSIPVKSSEMTDFEAGGNQAQIVGLDTGRKMLRAANVHLEDSPWNHKSKAFELIHDGTDIIAGDLNSFPFFPAIRTIKKNGYESAYKSVRGREPAATFPNFSADKLIQDRYLKQDEVDNLKKLATLLYPFSAEKHEIPAYTRDYVFLAKSVLQATHAELVKGRTRHSAPMSDHAGIYIQAS